MNELDHCHTALYAEYSFGLNWSAVFAFFYMCCFFGNFLPFIVTPIIHTGLRCYHCVNYYQDMSLFKVGLSFVSDLGSYSKLYQKKESRIQWKEKWHCVALSLELSIISILVQRLLPAHAISKICLYEYWPHALCPAQHYWDPFQSRVIDHKTWAHFSKTFYFAEFFSVVKITLKAELLTVCPEEEEEEKLGQEVAVASLCWHPTSCHWVANEMKESKKSNQTSIFSCGARPFQLFCAVIISIALKLSRWGPCNECTEVMISHYDLRIPCWMHCQGCTLSWGELLLQNTFTVNIGSSSSRVLHPATAQLKNVSVTKGTGERHV